MTHPFDGRLCNSFCKAVRLRCGPSRNRPPARRLLVLACIPPPKVHLSPSADKSTLHHFASSEMDRIRGGLVLPLLHLAPFCILPLELQRQRTRPGHRYRRANSTMLQQFEPKSDGAINSANGATLMSHPICSASSIADCGL
mmetsp:Transcript_50363/g.83442  ORF Transcript_50363/g.83442 Transcript_50363/m.83442 type:complete len:142 (-) Transcript_50363:117-542(-)